MHVIAESPIRTIGTLSSNPIQLISSMFFRNGNPSFLCAAITIVCASRAPQAPTRGERDALKSAHATKTNSRLRSRAWQSYSPLRPRAWTHNLKNVDDMSCIRLLPGMPIVLIGRSGYYNRYPLLRADSVFHHPKIRGGQNTPEP